MNKLIILPTVLIIIVAGFLTIPSEPTNSIVFEIPDTNESKIVVGDVELIVNNDDIVPVTIIDQILSEPPDLIIPINSELPPSILNEIQYSFEEETVIDVTINEYELIRTIHFNDGSIDEQSTLSELITLDFIALDNDIREINNGKISFKLTVPIQKPIRLAQGEFTFYYIESGESKNIKTVNYVFNTKSQSDVINDSLIMLDNEIQLSSILSSSPLGTHEFKVVLNKMFIIYDDNSREYANPNKTIYTTNIEKSDTQSIIKNESGVMIKSFDFDVPISISSNIQSVSATMCLSSCRGGGCCSQSTSSSTIPAPQMGSVTITNMESGEVVAQMDSVGKGSCRTDYRYNSFGNQAYCAGNPSMTGGSSLGYSAQRGQSYEISVSDPVTSWIIDIPITGGEYKYSCIADQGTSQGSSIGRNCNFPQ